MSGYTIFNVNGEIVKGFMAKNDTAAMMIAFAEGLDQFTLARTGCANIILRVVAKIDNLTVC